MSDSAYSFPFKCSSCEHPLTVDRDRPPPDDEIISCKGCGKEFGSYAKVKEAAFVLAKAEFDNLTQERLLDLPFPDIQKA